MGLAVSQVRLLALTRRKADIELDIQVDSKRKQALTRKSTELSQTYYQKLQQAKIQYATSDGYENVNYDYVMGKSNGVAYDDDFLKQVLYMSGNIDQKTCNSMILTDKYGKVVLNDEMAELITATKAAFSGQNVTTEKQTAEAIKAFIEQNSNVTGYGAADPSTDDVKTGLAAALQRIDKAFENGSSGVSSADIISKMLKNGGYQEGGTLYLVDGTTDKYVTSAEKAKGGGDLHPEDYVTLQDGYNYTILTSSGAIADSSTYTCMYDRASKTFVKNTQKAQMKYLSNVVTYFGPMISAALKNGSTSTVKITGVKHPTDQTMLTQKANAISDDSPNGEYHVSGTDTPQDLAGRTLTADNTYCIITDKDGSKSIWQRVGGNVTRVNDISRIKTEVTEHDNYINARDTKALQAGFQSGLYQLCMVDNMAKGRYHKNTTLDFFIQMSYVSEKLDSSAREEITAWYNSEQNKISEQETCWDTEITNLSTELSSVNTEIDSVKTLKSNAIKSVFDWGSN